MDLLPVDEEEVKMRPTSQIRDELLIRLRDKIMPTAFEVLDNRVDEVSSDLEALQKFEQDMNELGDNSAAAKTKIAEFLSSRKGCISLGPSSLLAAFEDKTLSIHLARRRGQLKW